jgi:hypothetical protein
MVLPSGCPAAVFFRGAVLKGRRGASSPTGAAAAVGAAISTAALWHCLVLAGVYLTIDL